MKAVVGAWRQRRRQHIRVRSRVQRRRGHNLTRQLVDLEHPAVRAGQRVGQHPAGRHAGQRRRRHHHWSGVTRRHGVREVVGTIRTGGNGGRGRAAAALRRHHEHVVIRHCRSARYDPREGVHGPVGQSVARVRHVPTASDRENRADHHSSPAGHGEEAVGRLAELETSVARSDRADRAAAAGAAVDGHRGIAGRSGHQGLHEEGLGRGDRPWNKNTLISDPNRHVWMLDLTWHDWTSIWFWWLSLRLNCWTLNWIGRCLVQHDVVLVYLFCLGLTLIWFALNLIWIYRIKCKWDSKRNQSNLDLIWIKFEYDLRSVWDLIWIQFEIDLSLFWNRLEISLIWTWFEICLECDLN